jgi:PBP1b-binding outer membrane lipoprotein LpoB
MKFIGTILMLCFLIVGCTESNTPEHIQVIDTIKKDSLPKAITYLQTNFPDRVFKFKKMPDANLEEQVLKYEKFAELFVEFANLYKSELLYSPDDRERNINSYNVLRDELASLKEKLKKNAATISQKQEARLDAADARMNVYAPNMYK